MAGTAKRVCRGNRVFPELVSLWDMINTFMHLGLSTSLKFLERDRCLIEKALLERGHLELTNEQEAKQLSSTLGLVKSVCDKVGLTETARRTESLIGIIAYKLLLQDVEK